MIVIAFQTTRFVLTSIVLCDDGVKPLSYIRVNLLIQSTRHGVTLDV